MTREFKIKTKEVSWYDKSKKKILWGIDIKIDEKDWAHVKDENGALFFETKEEARAEALKLHDEIGNIKL